MQEFGDLSGIVVNIRTNEVIGGNQRTSILQKYPQEARIEIISTNPSPDAQGTVKVGFVHFKGGVFSYREVDWDSDKEARANIIANKAGGFWDNDILANEFDENILLESGFEDFELGFYNTPAFDSSEGREKDEDRLEETLNTYLDGSIKQIVLYFKKEDYDVVLEKLEKIQMENGLSSFTEVFELLLKSYENSQS